MSYAKKAKTRQRTAPKLAYKKTMDRQELHLNRYVIVRQRIKADKMVLKLVYGLYSEESR